MRKPLWLLLLFANAIVLLGLLWPAGAPSFAPQVNVTTLVANLMVFLFLFLRARGGSTVSKKK